MPLREELERHGELLFRWRRYLPVLILPLLIVALPYSGYGPKWLGKEETDAGFACLCGAGVAAYVVLRTLKKRTTLLQS
jgi:hypothetical protein